MHRRASAQCAGRRVTTVEGLAGADGELSALQQAFVAHGAAQCGVCTPGMLMSAEALLRRNPKPDEAEVQDALAGVLCRCTGYRKIVEAVLAVSAGASVPAVGPPAGCAVGARAARLDGAGQGARQPSASAPTRCRAGAGAAAAPARACARRTRMPRFELGDLAACARATPDWSTC